MTLCWNHKLVVSINWNDWLFTKYLKYEISKSWGWIDQLVGKRNTCMLESEIYSWKCQIGFSSSISIIQRVDTVSVRIVWKKLNSIQVKSKHVLFKYKACGQIHPLWIWVCLKMQLVSSYFFLKSRIINEMGRYIMGI